MNKRRPLFFSPRFVLRNMIPMFTSIHRLESPVKEPHIYKGIDLGICFNRGIKKKKGRAEAFTFV
jgi:hypothetical protein